MAASWGYGPTDGPATWAQKFPLANGERQSPINIEKAKVKHDKALSDKPLKISYKPESGMCVSNTGSTFKADCKQESTVTGGPLGDKVYRLTQFHIHWGADDSRGSEHTIDGKVFSAELHMVHWNSTSYKSFEEASDKSDGLAMLTMFIKVGKAHKGFEAVSSQLQKISMKGDQVTIGSFDPSCLLPGNTSRYWTYPGALTVPPCHESVQFILFEEPLEFSADQMKALRSMHFGRDGSDCMVDNFRPPVPIGKRTVLASFA